MVALVIADLMFRAHFVVTACQFCHFGNFNVPPDLGACQFGKMVRFLASVMPFPHRLEQFFYGRAVLFAVKKWAFGSAFPNLGTNASQTERTNWLYDNRINEMGYRTGK